MVAVCAVALGMAAVPGIAGAASPTELTASSMHRTITWGGNTVLTATLIDLDTITALGGLWVDVEWSPTGSPASWTRFATVTTETEAQYATGQYAQVVQPRKLRYYRFVFAGVAGLAPSVSNTVTVRVRPALGRPVTRKAVKARKRFNVWGSLKPRFTAGQKTVKIKVYRAKGRRWVVVKRLAAVNLDTAKYSKYRVTTRLNARGRYRFRAYTLTMDGWAPAQSKLSRVLAVR